MRKLILLTALAMALLLPALATAADNTGPVTGCSPKYAAIGQSAKVKFQGTGDLEITIVTDPLCWHCRLGHKLLNEYPELYGTVNVAFFPRRQFIGSDMAAWILEDAAGTPSLKDKLDFAYKNLKQPKTESLADARMIVLQQFLVFFPDMLGDASVEELYARLQKDHEAHVLETARLCEEAELAGTPIMIAGKIILMGYGAGPWIKALKEKQYCN